MIYRNLGSETTIGDKPTLKRLGQPIELDESLAAEAIEGGALLLTENEFAALGLTDDELKKYATVGAQSRAPEGVAAKLKAGRDKVHDVRLRIEAERFNAPHAAAMGITEKEFMRDIGAVDYKAGLNA